MTSDFGRSRFIRDHQKRVDTTQTIHVLERDINRGSDIHGDREIELEIGECVNGRLGSI